MKRNTLTLLTVVILVGSTALFGQKAKSTSVGNFPFWSGPKGGYTGQYVPGLNAVLMLTPAQIGQIEAARQSTVGSDSLREALQTAKDPNTGEAQRQAARVALEKAQQDLRQQTDAILTPDQKALIARINTLYADTRSKVAREFEARLIGAKGNEDDTRALRQEMQERVAADFSKALDGILTPEQKAAMARAAEMEKQAATKKKGDK